jgi:hypothetical protein
MDRMSEIPASPWIHIGECPVCVNGLCRLRTCTASNGSMHFYAMCDECESLWLEPNTDTERMFPDASQPLCPICGERLYGEQAHWSQASELQGTQWATSAIYELPNSMSPDSRSLAENDADLSYGQDEPKPGC